MPMNARADRLRLCFYLGLVVAIAAAPINATLLSWPAALLQQFPPLGFLAAGWVLAKRMPDRRDPSLLIGAGLVWAIGNLATQYSMPVVRGLAELTFDVPELFIVWLVLALPGGQLRTDRERGLVVAVGVVTCILAPLQTLLLPPVHDPVSINAPALADIVNVAVLISGVVLCIVLSTMMISRYRSASVVGRRILGPVLLATATIAALMIATTIANALGPDKASYGNLDFSNVYDIIGAAQTISWTLLALAFFIAVTRSRADAGAVGRLLPRLSDDVPVDQLQAMLARAVNDPSLTLELEPPGSGVTAEGRTSSDVIFGDHVLARIEHDSALSEHPAALDAVIAALALLLGRRQLTRSLNEAAEQSGVDRDRLETDLLRLRDAFGAFVDPAVAESAIEIGWEVGGREVDVTVFFLDVRGFTSWAEHARPTQIVNRMNALWDVVVPIVSAHGGHANKFIGDGLLAVFGAPRPCPDHAARAVETAAAIVSAVAERFSGDLEVGIGVHTGTVMAGTIGGGGRVEFTVMGDVVNTASRIESATRTTGDTVLISDATLARLNRPTDFDVRSEIILKGKAASVELWAPVKSARALPVT